MPDFRADPSATPEGKGRARAMWDAYARRVNSVALPLLEPSIERLAKSMTVDLVGFWVMWHLNGGFEGMVEYGMHPTTVWRKVRRFRMAFGVHPDEFRCPGIELDPVKYWDDARKRSVRPDEK
ncbi:MAG: hypothetical protein AB7L13_08165 [Acidimicrobiia bacterium]